MASALNDYLRNAAYCRARMTEEAGRPLERVYEHAMIAWDLLASTQEEAGLTGLTAPATWSPT